MTSIRLHVPKTFSRKSRSLFEVAMWKATEFRLFLLYTGPVVLRNNLPKNVYKHFMLLSVAMRILLSPDLCSDFSEYANQLLHVFVDIFSKLYGPEFIVSNVHNLIHLAEDARKHGPLDLISCFPFENFLGKVKKMVRQPLHPVQQVVKRVHEKQKVKANRQDDSVLNQHKKLHLSGPLPQGFEACKQFKQYYGENIFISCGTGDNCFVLNGQICLVSNILYSSSGDTYVVCDCFSNIDLFYDYPIDSSALGIKLVHGLRGQWQVFPVTEFTKKMVLLPYNGAFVALPLLHDC